MYGESEWFYLWTDIDAIENRCFALAQTCYLRMNNMTHSNGQRMFEIYGRHDHKLRTVQGSVIAFNVKMSNGSYVHFPQRRKNARVKRRTGWLWFVRWE